MAFPCGVSIEFSDVFEDVEFCHWIRKVCNDIARVIFILDKIGG